MGGELRTKLQKTKKGGNCFSQIITLVCRRTNRKLVLELLFKTFLFLNKQLHKALERLKCLDFLGEQVKEPRFRVFLEGKKQKKGQLYLACSLEPYIMYINNLTV